MFLALVVFPLSFELSIILEDESALAMHDVTVFNRASILHPEVFFGEDQATVLIINRPILLKSDSHFDAVCPHVDS